MSVPTTRSQPVELPAVGTPALPAEFSHPALQQLLRQGTTNGVVDADTVREALEQSELPLRRMKVVLRTLDDRLRPTAWA